MNPDSLFQTGSMFATLGWLCLALSPLAPRWLNGLGGMAIPLLLSVAYTVLVLVHWADAPGGFGSLTEVAELFSSRWLLLAGWVHYLAFDLLLGGWETRTARREGMGHLLLLPCLALTFMFGPAGYLLFQALRLSLRSRATAAGGHPALSTHA